MPVKPKGSYGYEADIIKKQMARGSGDKALDAEYEKLTNQADNDYMSSIKTETREVTAEMKAKMKHSYDYCKLTNGLVPVNLLRMMVEKSGMAIDSAGMERMMKIATLVAIGDANNPALNFDQCCRLASNQIDVNMLHKLFTYANENTKFERVEFFLDVDEIQQLLAKIDIKKTKEEVNAAIDTLDRDSDGRVDWEEFLSVASLLIGSRICVDSNDIDGSEYNQLKENANTHKGKLNSTADYIKSLFGKIEQKKLEIKQKIEDTTLEDVRKKLKAAWDEKDRMELGVLKMKVGHFNEMKDLLIAQDAEKAGLVNKYREGVHARDHTRRSIDKCRDKFDQTFNSLVNYTEINALLKNIENVSSQVTASLEKTKEDSATLRGVWKEVAGQEQPPAVSNSEGPISFLSRQSRMIEEIKTKMRIMQRERDKYEDMIAEEMEKNKAKRIECVNLNSKITQLETKQMALEAKYKEYKIQNQTLRSELEEKLKDTDSKKVKQMKSIVFQFKEEDDAIREQVERTRMELRTAKKELGGCTKKTSRLHVELGELKILLEAVKQIDELQDKEQAEAEAQLLDDMVAYSGPGPDMPGGAAKGK